jgi:hypothetical protein
VASSDVGSTLLKLDQRWTRVESVLCVGVLGLEIAAFSFWIALKGVSMDSATSRAGLAFRAAFGAVAFGLAAGRFTKNRAPRPRAFATTAACALGALAGRASGDVGAAYFSNVLNWLQDSSALTLLGGLRGVGTELTWLLAMLGASLATGTGKHINIDALLRFAKATIRRPAVVFGWVTASVVCFSAVWGFFDHIAIGSFGAQADVPAAEKVSIAIRESGHHVFLLRKQIALDTRTAVRVLEGTRYDAWLHGAEWNAWIDDGGWRAEFGDDAVRSIRMPDTTASEVHPPLVLVPSGGYSRGLLTRDLHLVFPFGLLIIGIRFLLRAVLVALGRVDPDGEAHSFGARRDDEARETEAGA